MKWKRWTMKRNGTMSDVTLQELNQILFWAFRYTLGRTTYSVFDVANFILNHPELILPGVRSQIIQEIHQAIDDNLIGLDADKQAWIEVLQILEC